MAPFPPVSGGCDFRDPTVAAVGFPISGLSSNASSQPTPQDRKAREVSELPEPFFVRNTRSRQEGSTDDRDRAPNKEKAIAPGTGPALLDRGQGAQMVRAPGLADRRARLPELRQPRHARGQPSEDALPLPGLPQVLQREDRHRHGGLAVCRCASGRSRSTWTRRA